MTFRNKRNDDRPSPQNARCVFPPKKMYLIIKTTMNDQYTITVIIPPSQRPFQIRKNTFYLTKPPQFTFQTQSINLKHRHSIFFIVPRHHYLPTRHQHPQPHPHLQQRSLSHLLPLQRSEGHHRHQEILYRDWKIISFKKNDNT